VPELLPKKLNDATVEITDKCRQASINVAGYSTIGDVEGKQPS